MCKLIDSFAVEASQISWPIQQCLRKNIAPPMLLQFSHTYVESLQHSSAVAPRLSMPRSSRAIGTQNYRTSMHSVDMCTQVTMGSSHIALWKFAKLWAQSSLLQYICGCLYCRGHLAFACVCDGCSGQPAIGHVQAIRPD